MGALLSFVTAFFNFIPLWISLSRAPLSCFLPPFDPPSDGAGAAGGGGAPGGGGGGGGGIVFILSYTENITNIKRLSTRLNFKIASNMQ